MSFRIYAIIIIFALFIIITIINPRLSCFGRWIKSPLYPLLRKRRQKQVKTTDYGFKLSEGKTSALSKRPPSLPKKEKLPSSKVKNIKTEDYGFKLSGDNHESKSDQDESDKSGDNKS